MTLAPVQSVNGETGDVEVQQFKIYAKANEAITKGQLVMFAGAQGSHILMELCDQGAAGFDPTYVMGVAESTLAIGDFGYAIAEGVLTDLNTSSFTDGDILFSDPSTAGAFTTTQPTPPDHAVQVAAVRYAHATQGTLQIRVLHISDTDETPEGSTNLYYTDGRVDTRIAATSVTALSDVTSAGSGAIITSAERTKLGGIDTGAQLNVQSDWNEAGTGSDAYIKNKPTIPTNSDQLTEGSTNLFYTDQRVSANSDVFANTTKLLGIQAGAEVNVNADWNASTGDAAILNKPTLVEDLTDLGDTPAGYGTAGQALVTNATATGTEWATLSGSGIAAVVDDTTPQLGGDLDVNGKYLDLTQNTAGTLLVTGNQYAFRFRSGTSGAPANTGLYFSTTNGAYEFLNGSSVAIFQIKAGTGETTIANAFTLPITDGTANQVLQTDGSGNVDWATISTGGVSTPTLVGIASGRMNVTSTAGSTMLLEAGGGSLGTFYYNFNRVLSGATPPTGLGTPGTTTFSITPYNSTSSMFFVPVDGTVRIAGQCVCDGSSEVTGVKNRLYVFKVSATLLANMANSVYQAADTTTLVCSVEWNNPSANQSITPE
jgi:hypothetical protein